MAGTRSTMDESQSLSIDARGCRLWWLDDVHGKTIFFLENHGIASSEPKLYAGWGGEWAWVTGVVCAHTGLVCTLVCAQQHIRHKI